MKTSLRLPLILALVGAVSAFAQAPKAGTEFKAGDPLGAINEKGVATPMTSNVRVFGSFRHAESVTYDAERNLLIVMNAGVAPEMQENDGYASLLHPDGTVHTAKWIGNTRDGLTLDQPFGSALVGDTLYVADIKVVRTFNRLTGKPGRDYPIAGATRLNGIAVTRDGTIYVSNTTNPEAIFKVTADGTVSTFAIGAPVARPNGVALDEKGNIVIVNMTDSGVLTFNPEGKLILTENALESGSDGLVILKDGTKYVSSVRYGSISQIKPGQKAKQIAAGIPAAASMGYDSKQNQLVIPMNANNAVAFIKLTD